MGKNPVILQSENLTIRQAKKAETSKVVEYYLNNRMYLKPFEPSRPDYFFTEKFWLDQIKQNIIDFKLDKALRLFISLKENDKQIIGVINFSNFIRGVFQAAFLGYSIDEQFQGKGLMTEALQTSIDFMFSELNFHRIMANCMVTNLASLAVLKKLGFTVEGEAKDYLQINGNWENHILTALINDKYKE